MHEDVLVDKFNMSLSWYDEKWVFIVYLAVHFLELPESDGLGQLNLKKLHVFFDFPVV
jgi:hypothetical protein